MKVRSIAAFAFSLFLRQPSVRSFSCEMSSIVIDSSPLGFPIRTEDPFLFCVYHKDDYPHGDGKMQAPRRGNGHDFGPDQPYRMYHGDRVPGFPQHPHRGFETVTATIEGIIDHSDSLGNGGRYGHGDVQWMTAGQGVVHGEMFPLVNDAAPNPTKFFQIWLNLPKSSKMAPPAFAMHWSENIPRIVAPDGLSKVILWAGSYGGKTGLPPPPDSWGADPRNEVGIYFLQISPGGNVSLPAADDGDNVSRVLYFVEGESLTVNGDEFRDHTALVVQAGKEARLGNKEGARSMSEVLVLQGRRIKDPVVQHGPFVMNTADEIQQAFSDYRKTGFGGWPWPEDAMIFPKNKGRFSLQNGVEEFPPEK